jgi:serine protease
MHKRMLMVLLAVIALAAGSSRAATVDPELQQQLDEKAGGEMVRVMMLLEDRADLASLEPALAGLDHQQRRQMVIEALKSHAVASQTEVMAIIRAAERSGDARGVRTLWLVNGIAFRGDQQVVARLAAAKTTGTLFHDKAYDMLSSVTGPQRQPTETNGSGTEAERPMLQPAAVDTAWGVKWIKANRVWLDTGYTGAGIVVGHFDTGVWLTHPDIANRLWVNPGEIPGNGIDDDLNGYVDDVNGWDFADQDSNPNDDVTGGASNHGTHTAGTVCGDGTNGTITGVAPGASVMVCKSYLSDGSGAPFSAIYEGQQYAIEMGARIFTMSLGIAGEFPASMMRTEREIGDVIRAAGVIFFNSAGNDRVAYNPPFEIGLTARVPAPWNPIASTPYTSRGGVCAVGGTGYKSDTSYSSSSMGPVNWGDVPPWYDWTYPPGLIKPDMCAPAVGINSLQKPSGYTGDTWSGTSMSCPHVAGLAALMLSKNPSLSPAGVDSIIEQTCVDLGTVGKDNTYGSGRVNALAAVNAVPASLRPHLVWTDRTLDPGGDGVLDPGETVNLTFELTNNSSVVTATGVTAGLAVAANPYVTVTDGTSSFGTIVMNGGTADNSGDAFTLHATAGAPQGYKFTLYLTVYAQNGYQTTFNVDLFVGLPAYMTHDAGSVYLTVTDQGIIGYMDDEQSAGLGFGSLASGGSYLFLGSLWGGTGSTYICNRDYHGLAGSTETYEWVVMTSPNGRVKNLGNTVSDQDFRAIFSDAGHATPKNVVVTQYSYAWAAPGYDDFVIITYQIRNDGGSSIADYSAGIFCDFDVDDYSTNEGATDAGRHLTYMYSSSGNYVGIALLYPHTHRNLTLIHNPTYVYPNGAIDDGIKGRHLRGILSTPTSTAPDDWSALTSAGGFTLAPGDSLKFSFALVYGESLADLQDNTDAAQQVYYTTPVVESIPVRELELGQNFPNPFNPATTISFTVEKEGPVSVVIYDMSGRKIRNLVSASYGPGAHTAVWDGKDDSGAPMPSGLYAYRYESGGKALSRKMMLVK